MLSISRMQPGSPGRRTLAVAAALHQLTGAAGAVELGPTLPHDTPPADAAAVDKSQFTVWNPTPRDVLREMEASFRF